MEENIPQYRPGQFVKVNAPGRYRVASAKGDVCDKCDLSNECSTRRDLFENGSCVATVGWDGYLVRVK